ncbi:MAG TPA: hypothetical protein PKD86_14610, partial [Gemmatales bacterium]|nr:hypothetical protein [Gemmatales bacterium]
MRTMLVFLNLVVGTSLFLAEPPHDPREAWTVAPTWTVGRELVYRGQVRDQNQGRGVHFAKEYALKVRALVLDVDDDGWAHLAGCTRLQQTQQTTAADAVSLVLDQAQVDGLGRSRAAEGNALPPVHPEGPNSREWGFLFELPAATIKLKQTWTLHGPGQPPRQATVQGPVTLGSVPCLLVQVGQQSDDWDQPRADSTAWRVVERLWIGLRNGLMQRVERVIERRAPAHREVTQRITTEYELESQLRYDGLFLEDRRRDIALTLDVQEQLRALRRDTARAGAAPFQTLVARIDASSKQHPATPYREVLIRLRSQAVAGSQNRLPPPVALEGGPAAPVGLAVGRPAPEFAVRALEGQSTLTLRACRGKPTLLAFVQPVSVAT